MVSGWSVFLLAFFSLLSVLLAVGCLWEDFCVIYFDIFGRFVVSSRGFVFCKLLIFNNLLQVVQAEPEPGGPGTSA
jgi:hypothetical protein